MFLKLVQTTNTLIKAPLRYYVTSKFKFTVNKFNDIHINSGDLLANFSDPKKFEINLKESLECWSIEKRSSIWLYVPIQMSHLAGISNLFGFKYHHAENEEAVLYKWLGIDGNESKVPLFASHQVGVAGVVFREDTRQLLMIQDRWMVRHLWKFPGGAGEEII